MNLGLSGLSGFPAAVPRTRGETLVQQTAPVISDQIDQSSYERALGFKPHFGQSNPVVGLSVLFIQGTLREVYISSVTSRLAVKAQLSCSQSLKELKCSISII